MTPTKARINRPITPVETVSVSLLHPTCEDLDLFLYRPAAQDLEMELR